MLKDLAHIERCSPSRLLHEAFHHMSDGESEGIAFDSIFLRLELLHIPLSPHETAVQEFGFCAAKPDSKAAGKINFSILAGPICTVDCRLTVVPGHRVFLRGECLLG